MGRIPEEELERIKRENDLASAVRSSGVELKAHFLGQFAQGRLLGRLARIDPAAGQGPLAGVAAQGDRPAGEDQRRPAAPRNGGWQAGQLRAPAFLDDCHGHRSNPVSAGRGCAQLERRQVLSDEVAKRRVELHDGDLSSTAAIAAHTLHSTHRFGLRHEQFN